MQCHCSCSCCILAVLLIFKLKKDTLDAKHPGCHRYLWYQCMGSNISMEIWECGSCISWIMTRKNCTIPKQEGRGCKTLSFKCTSPTQTTIKEQRSNYRQVIQDQKKYRHTCMSSIYTAVYTLQQWRSELHSKTGVKVLPQGTLQMWEWLSLLYNSLVNREHL